MPHRLKKKNVVFGCPPRHVTTVALDDVQQHPPAIARGICTVRLHQGVTAGGNTAFRSRTDKVDEPRFLIGHLRKMVVKHFHDRFLRLGYRRPFAKSFERYCPFAKFFQR